jgi:KUP system potassium uptake protein
VSVTLHGATGSMPVAIPPQDQPGARVPRGAALAGLSLAALGVVYGDIGTSPLYALKQCFDEIHGVPATPANVLGVLSLVLWSLNFVISFKYISRVMRADNQGEGGILALLALIRPRGEPTGRQRLLIMLGVFGAALLYGDGVITPVISVLGAIEGLDVITHAFQPYIVPLAVGILLGLFWVQKRGTAGIGAIFGPIMVAWFVSIAALGVAGIARQPSVLRAINPWYALRFFQEDGLRGFLILGAVVLVLTGGEALYADMGHFGRKPIKVAWFGMVLPALTLNYFGQGALLLQSSSYADNPFFYLVPSWGRYAMVALATAAAIVASQALISGAFSLTRQAVQLGFCPRVTIRHTSATEAGQIYVPEVNWGLMIACIGLVLGFRSASNLASAYGIAVTGTMAITTVLFASVVRTKWNWPWWRVSLMAGVFLFVDLAFFSANLVKVTQGGWFPLVVGALVYLLMSTWKRGRLLLSGVMEENSLPIDLFLTDVVRRIPTRVPGTAVFMTSTPGGAPAVLLHHVKHNKVLHERVILMSVQTLSVPTVDEKDRVECRALGEGFYAVTARYGFMQSPDVPAALRDLGPFGITIKPMDTTYYLGRETLIATPPVPGAKLPPQERRMPRWRKILFVVMARNAQSATTFFNLPPNRVVEMGAQIQF